MGPYLPKWLRAQYRQAAEDCKSDVPLIENYTGPGDVLDLDIRFTGPPTTHTMVLVALYHDAYVGHVYVWGNNTRFPDALMMFGIRVALWTRFMGCSADKARPPHVLRTILEGVRQYAVAQGKKRIRTDDKPIGSMPSILRTWGWKGDVDGPMETYALDQSFLLGVNIHILSHPSS
jgi:hypothetical protein